MIIYIAKIPKDGILRLDGEENISLLPEDDKFAKTVGPVKYSLTAQYVSRELIVKGRLSATFNVLCTRCSEWFNLKIEENDFLIAENIFERSESLDLTDYIREAILFNFPSHPVCADSCKGICAGCGVNLNKENCKCVNKNDSHWTMLDSL